ncbi:hypothetical protein NW813_01975 [Synechococcus sp. R55.6]
MIFLEALVKVSVLRPELKSATFPQLHQLALASGELYFRALVAFWRVVRKKGLWLKPTGLLRWFPNTSENELHAHSAVRLWRRGALERIPCF